MCMFPICSDRVLGSVRNQEGDVFSVKATRAQGDGCSAELYSAFSYGSFIDCANTRRVIQLAEWDLQAGGSQVVHKIPR